MIDTGDQDVSLKDVGLQRTYYVKAKKNRKHIINMSPCQDELVPGKVVGKSVFLIPGRAATKSIMIMKFMKAKKAFNMAKITFEESIKARKSTNVPAGTGGDDQAGCGQSNQLQPDHRAADMCVCMCVCVYLCICVCVCVYMMGLYD